MTEVPTWMIIFQAIATISAVVLIGVGIFFARQAYMNYMIVNRILGQAMLLPKDGQDIDKIMRAKYEAGDDE